MLSIETPFHGAVLNHRHGTQTDDGLTITVTGRAPRDLPVEVNGVAATRAGQSFTAPLTLGAKETDIVAAATGPEGRSEHGIRVVWDQHSRPRYRFSVDDNSFFLRDIATRRYRSLFDCFYLKNYQTLHQKYGVKFVLNCYYTTEDGFTLADFPEQYKGEWADCAEWLKLSFHAYANKPDRPYQYASPQKLAEDFDLVAGEILRFAGDDTWSPPTVIHWGMTQPSALPALAARGVKVLSGFFRPRDGVYDVNYLLDDARCEYLSRHDALMDFGTGITFSRVDIVCNNTPIDNVVPTLQPLTEDTGTAEIMDLFTHEQYFWDFYVRHVPDHAERLDAAIRFVTEQGYEPVFFHEGFLGGEDVS